MAIFSAKQQKDNFYIKKGLNIPLSGKPSSFVSTPYAEKDIGQNTEQESYAILGDDYHNMKPQLFVKVGDSVKAGQKLFSNKKQEEIIFTAPASGTIQAINRGEKRKFESIVIRPDKTQKYVSFSQYTESEIPKLEVSTIKEYLLQTGLWTSLRQRPFSYIANPNQTPYSIFFTLTDSNPLAPNIQSIIKGREKELSCGLAVLSKLTSGNAFLCKSKKLDIASVKGLDKINNLQIKNFDGMHPSGNVGTHIHFLAPASLKKIVWHIGVQDIIAIGSTLLSGKLYTERIVALAGAGVDGPILVKTHVGANIQSIISNRIKDGDYKVISGSVLNGHYAEGNVGFLGRYHQQISVIPNDTNRKLLGWAMPGFSSFSFSNIFASKLNPFAKVSITNSTNGSTRPIFPLGFHDRVMPLDIVTSYLFRALATKDIEQAMELGALELDEEDLALCSVVCMAKQNYGMLLRECLDIIFKES